MTQPQPGTDLALISAVVAETLRQQAQQGVAQIAPAFASPPVHRELVCRRCGQPLDGVEWAPYVDHCAANHHSLLEQFAGHYADVELDEDLAALTDPDSDEDAHLRLAADLRDRDWPENPQSYIGVMA